MFRIFDRCLSALADKSGIDVDILKFDGFDANNEYEYLDAAKKLTCGDRASRAYNSHMPRLASYRELSSRWKASRDPENLTRADLLRIAAT